MKIEKGNFTRLNGYTLNQIYAVALCYGLIQSKEFDVTRFNNQLHQEVFLWDKHDHSPRQATEKDIRDDYNEIKVDHIISNMGRYLYHLDIGQYK